MDNLVIKPASKDEFSIAVEWAAAEGWNPGLDDVDAFFAADQNGFLMAWLNDQPVASISVVKYGDDFGFLGFYIVHPDHRGAGIGIAIWNAGMEYLANRTVGLDGVVEQVGNYEKSGFAKAGRNIRYTGVPIFDDSIVPNLIIRELAPDEIDKVIAYDRPFYQADRTNFIKAWINPDTSPDRKTKIALSGGKLTGYGTIRACRSGYKIGPLFANDPEIALAIFQQICSELPSGSEISLDVPETNIAGSSITIKCGLEPVFETARMYRGLYKPTDDTKIFGITTFELG